MQGTKGGYVKKNKREKVFKRDGYKCVHPNCNNWRGKLTIDHIIPISKGGTNDLDNLQTLCEHHNKQKANRIKKYI
jgi:5-methylcytosine-specific restriction endonuclease McrA